MMQEPMTTPPVGQTNRSQNDTRKVSLLHLLTAMLSASDIEYGLKKRYTNHKVGIVGGAAQEIEADDK